ATMALAGMLAACSSPQAVARPQPPESRPMSTRSELEALKRSLIEEHGESSRARIERGVEQVAALWRAEDGDLAVFARESFLPEGPELDAVFARFEANLEQLDGHLLEIGRELRRASDLDVGPLTLVDPLFAAYDPGAHVIDDFFENRLA